MHASKILHSEGKKIILQSPGLLFPLYSKKLKLKQWDLTDYTNIPRFLEHITLLYFSSCDKPGPVQSSSELIVVKQAEQRWKVQAQKVQIQIKILFQPAECKTSVTENATGWSKQNICLDLYFQDLNIPPLQNRQQSEPRWNQEQNRQPKYQNLLNEQRVANS